MLQHISEAAAKSRRAQTRFSRQYKRRMATDPEFAQQQKANCEAYVMISKWLQANRERAARLVGESQFKADWHAMNGDYRDPDSSSAKVWERVQQYDQFLISIENSESANVEGPKA